MRSRFACFAFLGLSACVGTSEIAGQSIALRDPLGLIDDVYASGNRLRLYVLPAEGYSCDPTTGTLTPALPDTPERPVDAIVDVLLARDEVDTRETVPVGRYVVFVRGKGTDIVSGETNREIARGCQTTEEVTEASTVMVSVTLAPVASSGVCGNGFVSPDEQCETTMPECGPDCRTRVETINTTAVGPQTRARVATRAGQRSLVIWESDATDIFTRLFDENGRTLTGPLAADASLDSLAPLPNTQLAGTPAIASDGRVAIALTDFPSADSDVRVGFFSNTLVQTGTYAQVRTNRAMRQGNPSIAYHSSGALLVLFEDAASATGVSGRLFAAGSTTPEGSEAFEVATGRTGVRAPQVAAMPGGFVAAFSSPTGVFYQRFATDGAPLDAEALPVADGSGARDQAAIAALPDGTFLVAWTEAVGASRQLRARAFGTDGTGGAVTTLTTTGSGDPNMPAVGAGGGRFLVAFQQGSAVRAAVLSSDGGSSLNRESPPTLGDFEVAPSGAAPVVTVIGSGAEQAWWIVWEGPGTSTDIFARRYLL